MWVSGKFHVPSTLRQYKSSPGNQWVGDWLGPRACMDVVQKSTAGILTQVFQPIARYERCYNIKHMLAAE
jgi:hypothetical protein